jgi:hypothetical protein
MRLDGLGAVLAAVVRGYGDLLPFFRCCGQLVVYLGMETASHLRQPLQISFQLECKVRIRCTSQPVEHRIGLHD